MVSLLFCVQMCVVLMLFGFFFVGFSVLFSSSTADSSNSVEYFCWSLYILAQHSVFVPRSTHRTHRTHTAQLHTRNTRAHTVTSMHSILSKWSILKPDHHLRPGRDDDDISLDSCLPFMLCHFIPCVCISIYICNARPHEATAMTSFGSHLLRFAVNMTYQIGRVLISIDHSVIPGS